MSRAEQILKQLDRVSRLTASFNRREDLNATQMAALGYLARAKGADRMPSKVADYLAATRGTVSQTLKALKRKGLIVETPSPTDGRSVEYALSPEGTRIASLENPLLGIIAGLSAAERRALHAGLGALISTLDAEAGASEMEKAPSPVAEQATDTPPADPVPQRVQSVGSAPPFPG